MVTPTSAGQHSIDQPGTVDRSRPVISVTAGTFFVACFTLLACGTIGICAGMVAHKPLIVLISVVVVATSMFLLRSVQQADAERREHEQTEDLVPDWDDSIFTGTVAWLWHGVFAILNRVATGVRVASVAVCEALRRFVRGLLKASACVVTGASLGMIITGAFALADPTPWSYDTIRHAGPPLGQSLLSVGIGLLGTEVLLFIAFRRTGTRT